jgi:redox-sensitive bicupin YhaK (pirin superfamily)
MRTVMRAADRGSTKIDWLDSQHSFSFGGFQDPERMGFRSLRVLNDDRVVPGGGFGTHGHRDMEILTWVLEGSIAHLDSLGNEQTIPAGEMQVMSAGTGVTHSEFNPSDDEELRFLQIWIVPEREGLEPGYEQRGLVSRERPGELVLVASRDGREGSMTVHQDVELHAAGLPSGRELSHGIAPGRHAFLHVARGEVEADGERLEEGASLALSDEPFLRLRARTDAEVLVFDLA